MGEIGFLTIGISASVVLLLGGAAVWVLKRSIDRQLDPQSVRVDGLVELSEKMDALIVDPEETPAALSDILERLEALERRVEQVHADSLDFLRRGEGARNRAQQLRREMDRAGDDDEEGMDPEEARALLAQANANAQAVTEQPLDWRE